MNWPESDVIFLFDKVLQVWTQYDKLVYITKMEWSITKKRYKLLQEIIEHIQDQEVALPEWNLCFRVRGICSARSPIEWRRAQQVWQKYLKHSYTREIFILLMIGWSSHREFTEVSPLLFLTKVALRVLKIRINLQLFVKAGRSDFDESCSQSRIVTL